MNKVYICVRCGTFIKEEEINFIESGKDMCFYWCNDCVTKHLNSREDNK